ncbi:MAG: rod shape-determining protein RodA [Acidobacteriota bacterium]
MISRAALSRFDYVLFAGVIVLALIGVAGVYSAGVHGASGGFFQRQLLWVGLGILTCLITASIDYRFLVDHAPLLYCLSILALITVLVLGTEVNGSKSWIGVGGFNVQPSEIVKIVIILVLARYLAEINENYLRRKHFLGLAGITFLPVILIIMQGDLGTAAMYLPILFGMMVVAGLKMRFLAATMLLALCLAPIGWLCLEDYQRQRILVTLDPELDPQGVGYQTRQSQIAIGSGGILGKGFGNGLQGQLGFVPEIRTDFIFALLAEEKGLVGACVILLLYFLVLTRLVRIAERARDRAGILIVTGIASLVFFHIMLNVGMTLGILPTIGIPLPLLSYGGSSTLAIFAAFGLALSIHHRRYVY